MRVCPPFDIHREGTYILAQPVGPLYNGLLTFDVYAQSKIIGDLAERWEVSADGKRITFTLQKGVKFHDGAPFSCADTKYSLEKLADPKRSYSGFVAILKPIFDSVSCTNDTTLVLNLKQPSAAILTMLANANSVMMKAGIAEQFDAKDPKFLIGTGPFKFKSFTSGVDFRAERNPEYWKPGLPYLDGYQAVVMADLTKIFASFRARQLTMTGIGRHLERPEAEILKKDFPDAVVGLGPRAGWDSFVMHVGKPPFHDPRVRKAVALATDREKMIEIAAESWGVIGGVYRSPYALRIAARSDHALSAIRGRHGQAPGRSQETVGGSGLCQESAKFRGETLSDTAHCATLNLCVSHRNRRVSINCVSSCARSVRSSGADSSSAATPPWRTSIPSSKSSLTGAVSISTRSTSTARTMGATGLTPDTSG
jgi:ABC-type transport system substrate-binding protein